MLADLRKGFLTGVESEVRPLRRITRPRMHEPPKEFTNRVHEGQLRAARACLAIFALWEGFLEDTFEAYVMGEISPSGFQPPRYYLPPDLVLARRAISFLRPFAEWNKVGAVIDRAKLFFDGGEPYTSVLALISGDIDRLRRIRNRVAHGSRASREQYQQLLQEMFGSSKPEPTPGELLMRRPDGSMLISFGGKLPAVTLLGAYGEMLENAALHIVP
jgi:hypothetical protein